MTVACLASHRRRGRRARGPGRRGLIMGIVLCRASWHRPQSRSGSSGRRGPAKRQRTRSDPLMPISGRAADRRDAGPALPNASRSVHPLRTWLRRLTPGNLSTNLRELGHAGYRGRKKNRPIGGRVKTTVAPPPGRGRDWTVTHTNRVRQLPAVPKTITGQTAPHSYRDDAGTAKPPAAVR